MPSIVVELSAAPSPQHRSTLGREPARYLAVSLLALLVDFTVLTTLVSQGAVHYQIGAVAGFAAGTVVAFVLSVAWVFEHRSFDSWTTGLAAFAAIGAAGLAVSLIVMSAAVECLHADYRLAKCGAAIASFFFNFTARRVFLFARPPRRKNVP